MTATICRMHRTWISNNSYQLNSQLEWKSPSPILLRNRWSPRCQSRRTPCSPLELDIPTTTKLTWAWVATRWPSSNSICFSSIWARSRPWLKRFTLLLTTITKKLSMRWWIEQMSHLHTSRIFYCGVIESLTRQFTTINNYYWIQLISHRDKSKCI